MSNVIFPRLIVHILYYLIFKSIINWSFKMPVKLLIIIYLNFILIILFHSKLIIFIFFRHIFMRANLFFSINPKILQRHKILEILILCFLNIEKLILIFMILICQRLIIPLSIIFQANFILIIDFFLFFFSLMIIIIYSRATTIIKYSKWIIKALVVIIRILAIVFLRVWTSNINNLIFILE